MSIHGADLGNDRRATRTASMSYRGPPLAIGNYLRQDEDVGKRTGAEVGALVRERRLALGLRQEGVPNVSSSLVRMIERGTAPPGGRGLTRAALMEALRWPANGLELLADGVDPRMLDHAAQQDATDQAHPRAVDPSTAAEIADLRQEVAEVKELLRAPGRRCRALRGGPRLRRAAPTSRPRPGRHRVARPAAPLRGRRIAQSPGRRARGVDADRGSEGPGRRWHHASTRSAGRGRLTPGRDESPRPR